MDFLKPLRYLSKLTQTRDALVSKIYNQVRITRNNLNNVKNDKESDTREKEQIEAMIWTYTRDVKNEATGALDKL